MERQPAKVVVPKDVRRLLTHVGHRRHKHRNRVMVLLSFKAGLRACEISGLDWSMVLASNGKISDQLAIARTIAKRGSARRIPLHSDLKRALQRYHDVEGRPQTGALLRSQRGQPLTAASVVNWFGSTYRELGLVGCSSHSGRRTFITTSARVLAKTGGSLRDIQELAGHRALTTTERYIEGDRAAQRRLINLI
ncbi:tyrosine-type recombinase/integrase [Sphingomonas mesophila]|uniref:tyrosine-type recombinase/integrase n=1 Tax=Sphingomonas mesophila TaxID=2303576 RepID=UPI000E58D8EC|nr:site-specific integrase [Sphingomonas mesophila]